MLRTVRCGADIRRSNPIDHKNLPITQICSGERQTLSAVLLFFPAGIFSAGKSCVTKIGKICSERQIYKKKAAGAAPFRKREVSPYAHIKNGRGRRAFSEEGGFSVCAQKNGRGRRAPRNVGILSAWSLYKNWARHPPRPAWRKIMKRWLPS